MNETALTVLIIGGLSLVPLVLVVLTSYAKIAIVLAILRNAIGIPGVPPNLVITGLAVLLSGFVMAPVAGAVVRESRPHLEPLEHSSGASAADTIAALRRAARRAARPVREFLLAHGRPADRQLFAELARSLRGQITDRAPGQAADDNAPGRAADDKAPGRATGHNPPGAAVTVAHDDLAVLALAFATSQLRAAFLVGVAVLLPFLIIDLLVANVLVALGLSAMPVATVAVPLKLTLFVAVEGWQLLTRGLIAGYL